jgi:hypothetical protein
MKKLNQKGFGIVEGLLIFVAVALIAGTGYYVYKQSQNSDKAQSSVEVADKKKTNKEAPKADTLPSSYYEYKNEDIGFRFGYPKELGKIAVQPKGGTGIILSVGTPETTIVDKNLKGMLNMTLTKKDGFTTAPNKYGPTIKRSSDGTWRVVAVNPAITKYKVGDKYKLTEHKISGGTVFDSPYDDGDGFCTTHNWIIELDDSMAILSLPGLCVIDLDHNVTSTSKASYNSTIDTMLSTFKRF